MNDEQRAELLSKEWEVLFESGVRDFDKLHKYNLYFVVLIIAVFGFTINGGKVAQELAPFAPFLLLIVLFRMFAEIEYIYLKAWRVVEIEKLMAKLAPKGAPFQFGCSVPTYLEPFKGWRQPNLQMFILMLAVGIGGVIATEAYALLWLPQLLETLFGIEESVLLLRSGNILHGLVVLICLVFWVHQGYVLAREVLRRIK